MKKTVLSLVIISSLMLASCWKIDWTIKIEEDFSLNWKINLDLSNASDKSPSTTPCDFFNKYKADDYDMIKITECVNIDEENAELSLKWLSIIDSIKETDEWYSLNLITFLDILDWATTSEKASWTSYNYKLDFSKFDIIKNSIWKVNNNILEFSKSDIIETKDIKTNYWADENYVIFAKKWTNPKLDKELDLFFVEIDEKWEEEAKKVYNTIIKKIDSLIEKSKSNKNKKLLNYIKDKVLEKVK